MNITKTQENQTTTLALSGRLDTMTAPQLQEVLIPLLEQGNQVVLDFEKLDYVSSAGLRVLLLGAKSAEAHGGNQNLENVSPEIMEVLEMTGFNNVLTISTNL